MLTDLPPGLLPPSEHLRLETIDGDAWGITVVLAATAPAAACPACAHPATRVHSGYRRTLADLPWASTPVRLHLHVRRFFWDRPSCQRRTFTERLPAVAPPYARATPRLAHAQADTGLALGGAAGARLLTRQGLPTSRNTVLRRLRRLPPPTVPPPTVVGVDDWAQRKGRAYGTIIVDLERRRPIALLPDRSSQAVTAWLAERPSVRVIARDRAEGYAAGAAQGAPTATQVADRWHVLANVRQAVEVELGQHDLRLPTVEPAPLAPEGVAGPEPISCATPSGRRADARRLTRRDERLDQYHRLRAARRQGLPLAVSARRAGISRRTACRWLAAGAFPERKRRTGDTSALAPYHDYLLRRWGEGCHNATHLWREVRARGYSGAYGVVAGFLAPLRRGRPIRRRAARSQRESAAPAPALTARRLSFLLIRPPDERTAAEQQVLTQLCAQDGTIAALAALAENFAQMVRERTVEQFDGWLERALNSGLSELQRLATGIQHDEAAVRAALGLPWSTGPVEGHITRLKLVKRSMYGRAKLDLLRQRVLWAA